MVVDLVAKAGVTDLIKALELIEADRVSIRHDEPVEDNGETGLTGVINFPRLPEEFRPRGDENVLAVM
jgi:hypothetical protein